MARREQEDQGMGPNEAEKLEAALREIMVALLERVPDGYGRILRSVSAVTQDPTITAAAAMAYQDELAEVLEERPALPGVH